MRMSSEQPAPKSPWPDKLKKLRVHWGTATKPLSQEQAAIRLGVTSRSWAGWESGNQLPAVPVQKLIDLLLNNPSINLK